MNELETIKQMLDSGDKYYAFLALRMMNHSHIGELCVRIDQHTFPMIIRCERFSSPTCIVNTNTRSFLILSNIGIIRATAFENEIINEYKNYPIFDFRA